MHTLNICSPPLYSFRIGREKDCPLDEGEEGPLIDAKNPLNAGGVITLSVTG